VFANKIKRVEACLDARGHHFLHLYKCTATFRTSRLPCCVTACHHISAGLYRSLSARRLFELPPTPVRHRVPSHFNWTLPWPKCTATFRTSPTLVRHRVPSHFNWTLAWPKCTATFRTSPHFLASPCTITFQLDSTVP